jgi:hypothetical protein
VAHSRRQRHRDRDPGPRHFGGEEITAKHRAFRMDDEQRRQIARQLRFIDEARRALESEQNPANREIVRELRASADAIFDLLNDLEELDG